MDTKLININTKNIDKEKYNSSDFIFHMDEEIKNVSYIRLTSLRDTYDSIYFYNQKKTYHLK